MLKRYLLLLLLLPFLAACASLVEPFRGPVTITVVAGKEISKGHETCVVEIRNGQHLFNQAIPYAIDSRELTGAIGYFPEDNALLLNLGCGWGASFGANARRLEQGKAQNPKDVVYFPTETISSAGMSVPLILKDAGVDGSSITPDLIGELVNNGFVIDFNIHSKTAEISDNHIVSRVVINPFEVFLATTLAGLKQPALNLGCDHSIAVRAGKITVAPGSAIALDPADTHPFNQMVQKDSRFKVATWKFEGKLARVVC